MFSTHQNTAVPEGPGRSRKVSRKSSRKSFSRNSCFLESYWRKGPPYKFLCSVPEVFRKQNGRVSVRQIEKKAQKRTKGRFRVQPPSPSSPASPPSFLLFSPFSSYLISVISLAPSIPPFLLPHLSSSLLSLLPPPPFAVPLPSLPSSLFAFPVPFSIRFLPEEKELVFLLVIKKVAQRKTPPKSPQSRKVLEGPGRFPGRHPGRVLMILRR